jgi:CPA2 family monovalent cation:H+ antiporter-2
MDESEGLRNVLVLLAAAIVAVPLFHRLRLSSVLGYLAAGMVVGPFGAGLIHDVEAASAVAEYGVVFLLFAIGLDLPLQRLRAVWRYLFGLGLAQVVVTALVFTGAARLTGVSNEAAIVIGGALAMSSTATVLQLLRERGELVTRFGRIVIAVLLFQDLAVIPMLALLPLLPQEGTTLMTALGLAFVKAVLALVLVVALGRLVVRPSYSAIAAMRVPEIFAAANLLVVLGTGWLTAQFGMSMALGAFLAGLLLAETEFRHQIEADIAPFRGLFLGLFFISVGMQIDLPFIARNMALVLALAAGLLVAKAAILFGLCAAFRLERAVATRAAVQLAQGGEFAFVIFALATGLGILAPEIASLLVATVSLTIAVTPPLAMLGARLSKRLEPKERDETERIAAEAQGLENHVIIAGFGRVGQIVAQLLTEKGIAHLAIDLDMAAVRKGRERGAPLYFGDASHAEVLAAAGVERAAGAVITIDQPGAAEQVVAALHRAHPGLRIVVRGRDAEHGARLARAGADAVVQEAVEPGLQMAASALGFVGIQAEEVSHTVETFRRARSGDVPRA